MEDIRFFFQEIEESFTIYVVEQRFVVGRGAEYFRSFKGKVNYIDSNNIIKSRLDKIVHAISKSIPNVVELVQCGFGYSSPLDILDIISSLSKIFSVYEHQAAGPDVIDPIIIQEGEILPKYLERLIALHKSSILKPIIIILLKDNNFERAKELLSGCPHNTNIKMIRNSGATEIFKVINCGADSPDDFLDAFSHQCFSTCSNTKRNILYSQEWAENSLVKLYGPTLLQFRTNFLFNDKTLVREDLSGLIEKLDFNSTLNDFERKIIQSFQCMAKLFRVFCNDGGKQDMKDAYELAKSVDNEILLAHVHRYAYFLDKYTFDEKLQLLDSAYDVFVKNKMEDHAIYCKNNRLVRQFDTDSVNINDFRKLQEEAIYNVPGLVGMSHILNNVGVAHLVGGCSDESLTFFEKGLDYTHGPERCVQKLALLSNAIIAKHYCFNKIDETEFKRTLNLIFDNQELLNLPFISGRYAMNIIAVAFSQNTTTGQELLQQYPIGRLVQKAFKDNIMGSGQLLLQINMLDQKYDKFNLLEKCILPQQCLPISGVRKKFIINNTFNPFAFSTWI